MVSNIFELSYLRTFWSISNAHLLGDDLPIAAEHLHLLRGHRVLAGPHAQPLAAAHRAGAPRAPLRHPALGWNIIIITHHHLAFWFLKPLCATQHDPTSKWRWIWRNYIISAIIINHLPISFVTNCYQLMDTSFKEFTVFGSWNLSVNTTLRSNVSDNVL